MALTSRQVWKLYQAAVEAEMDELPRRDLDPHIQQGAREIVAKCKNYSLPEAKMRQSSQTRMTVVLDKANDAANRVEKALMVRNLVRVIRPAYESYQRSKQARQSRN